MKKRQKKKNKKKYLPIIADEFNLTTMTREELEQANKDYQEYRERYAFRKKYKDLNEGKSLYHSFPVGQKVTNTLKELSSIARSARKSSTVTQSIDDFKS
ncbi:MULTISPECIES: hypothetical protein [Metabacillus]|uniref:hypothetical protein n=1 Tax=Metabacillus TaxID=2675233 RepID=UPI000C80925B|nr:MULTISPECIES: hypothetical protein [Metabacillus]MCM3443978.1 hypothetical protein [Metabacillus halosaccharovorans]PMC34967.1 hypothetical protein CJ195_20895 [Bacillus sp. UMB0899]